MSGDPYYRSQEWHRLGQARPKLDHFTCIVPGCGQPATVVDHIVSRHAGGPDALGNLRSLCTEHDHSVKELPTGARRNGGKLAFKGCYPDGLPRDPNHPWHRGAR